MSERGADASTDVAERRMPAIVEIGPHDLPEPAGGWIDLVLDDDASGPAASTPGAPEPSPALPDLPHPAPAREAARAVVDGTERPPRSRARARGRWILLPEALVVAAFVLSGAALAGAMLLLRRPVAPAIAARAASEPAAAVAVHAPPRGHPLRRAPREAAAPPAPAPEVEPSAEPETPPIAPEAPVDPEAPPAPDLAPWDGGR